MISYCYASQSNNDDSKNDMEGGVLHFYVFVLDKTFMSAILEQNAKICTLVNRTFCFLCFVFLEMLHILLWLDGR